MRRTRKAGKEEPVPTRVNKKGLVLPSLDLLIGLLGSLSVVLILASFPLLGAAAVALLGFVSIGQMYPKLVFAIAKTGEVAGGLVLALGMADKGIEVLVASARSVCAGGVSFIVRSGGVVTRPYDGTTRTYYVRYEGYMYYRI